MMPRRLYLCRAALDGCKLLFRISPRDCGVVEFLDDLVAERGPPLGPQHAVLML